MRWIKGVVVSLALLAALALALPFLIPLDSYIPRLEQEATARLKQPVSIHSLRAALLPLPHVTVEGVRVGAGDVSVAALRIYPHLGSLASAPRIIDVQVDSPVLSQKGLAALSALGGGPSSGPPPVRLESVRLSNALANLNAGHIGPFDARLALDEAGKPREITISTPDGKLNATVTPSASGQIIAVAAKGWTLPAGPPLLFDELTVKGIATQDEAVFDSVAAKLYGGTVSGRLKVGWSKSLRLTGQFDIAHVETRSIAALLSPKTHVSGRLYAKPAISAAAPLPEQLAGALRVDSPFRIQNGVIHGVDVQKAATSLVKQGSSGGETRFEELSGRLVMERAAFHFTNLQVASGALAADGSVDISPKKELGGRINARVQVLGVSTGVPLNVSGTLDHPLLLPTGAYLAGAAVGTAVMGPGLGTTMGAKVGSWAEGLFGKKETDKDAEKGAKKPGK